MPTVIKRLYLLISAASLLTAGSAARADTGNRDPQTGGIWRWRRRGRWASECAPDCSFSFSAVAKRRR